MSFLYQQYSSNPDDNNAAPPIGAPEGATYVSEVNDIQRQDKAAIHDLGVNTPKLPDQPTRNVWGITDETPIGQAAYSDPSEFAQASDGVPIGSVTQFFGTAVDIPTNWVEMAGQVVTIKFPAGDRTVTLPDMAYKFPRGIGGTQVPGDSGGQDTATTSEDGAHDHTGETDGTVLANANLPANMTVSWAMQTSSNNTGSIPAATQGGDGGTGTATINGGQDQPHTHGIQLDGAHSHTLSNVPEYVTFRYIIRIS